MSRKNNLYSKELKLKAVYMYLVEGLSLQAISLELKIKHEIQIRRWVKLYSEKGETAFDKETRGRPKESRKVGTKNILNH